MIKRHGPRAPRRAVAVVTLFGSLLAGWPAPAHAAVATTIGSAYGYMARVQIFTDPVQQYGPTPTVTLPTGGSASPLSQSDPSASAIFGPATIFSSGQLTASTQGATGPGGSVSSSSTIVNVNASEQEVLTASQISSTCTATETGVTGSTTITSGVLQTDSGDDNPVNSIPDHPPVNVVLDSMPAPNTTILGHIHIGNVVDNFRYVFNEQIVNPDGSLTVNAAHQYLLGPSAVGDLIIGQSVCGVTSPSTTSRAVGDYNGDGTTDFAVYRPSSGQWWVKDGLSVAWGLPDDIPVPGDYNGDGSADVAVYRPSNGFWFVKDIATVGYGQPGDIPVPADYNGDGTTDIAIYRPSHGLWFVKDGPSAAWGVPDDIPVPGDYNGDGSTDFAVYRPSNGFWFVKDITTVSWGLAGDIPVVENRISPPSP